MKVLDARDEEINGTQKKTSIHEYAARLLNYSSISAVSSILSNDNISRRIFKTIIFMIFSAAFFCQCIKFLAFYFDYPTVVNIEVRKPNEYMAPAYTLCHSQRIKRSLYCKKYPENCTAVDKEFCRKHEQYCKVSDQRVKEEFIKESIKYEDLFELGYDYKSLVNSTHSPYLSEKNNIISEEMVLRLKFLPHDSQFDPSACLTINSAVDSPNNPAFFINPEYHIPHSTKPFYFQFHLNPQEEDIFYPDEKVGIYFAVHSPFEGKNPFLMGQFLRPGKSYKVNVHFKEDKLLKHPYKTDCIDFDEIWKNNNKSGPRSKQMCQEKCTAEVFSKCFNCSMPFVMYPSDKEVCDQQIKEKCSDLIINGYIQCLNACKDECFKISYFAAFNEVYLPILSEDNNGRHKKSRFIIVFLEIEDQAVLRYIFSPKYEVVEVFSYIGGFVGIWLGVSLVQVMDFMQSLYFIVRYFVKKGACKEIPQNV